MGGQRYWAGRAGAPSSKGVLDSPDWPSGVDVTPAAHTHGESPIALARYFPCAGLEHLVRHYWIPRWRLPEGRSVRQPVLDYPSANLVIEPGRAALHGPHRGRSVQTLEGTGWAFGALLQPGTARSLLGRPARAIAEGSIDLAELDVPSSMVDAVADATALGDDERAIALFEGWLQTTGWPDDPDGELIARVIALAEGDRSILRVEDLAEAAGVGVRGLQRLVGDRIGFTPKWVIQRYRLQEAAHRLADPSPPSLGELAADLGYADQAHFSRDFRTAIGETPARYLAHAGAPRIES